MSRPVYWASNDAYVLGDDGHPYARCPVRIYSAQTGGFQVTDLVFVSSTGVLGAAVPGGILISDQNGLIPAFAGPDGGPTTLWGDHGYGGARLALSADPVASSGGGAVSSVAGRTGAVVLGESDITGLVSDLSTLAAGIASKADAAATSSALAGKASTSTIVAAGTGLTGGGDLSTNRTLAVAYGTTSGTAAQGNDARLSDTRTPTDGSVTLAKMAFDPATQAELDTVAAAKADNATTITAGTGLTGGGDLSTSRTLTVTYGTTSGTAAQGNDSRIAGAAAAATTITAGTGLTGGGSLAANRTLAVSYGTASGTSVQGNDSRVVNAVQSTTVPAMERLTQAAYDALGGSVVATTVYIIVG